jgi:hypothetical protein
MTAPPATFTPPRTNPFATRFTRPGRVVPLDADGRPLDLDALLARLRALGGRAAIEGPHGSGKTSLLTALAAHLDARGGATRLIRVRGGAEAGGLLRAIARAAAGAFVGVDGWERLPWPVATAARWLAAQRSCGLVVTAHRATGLPVLHRCHTSSLVLARIVAQLPDHRGAIDDGDVADAFARHAGDLREALYDLYDRFERRAG